MPIIRFLSVVALFGSIAWMEAAPDYAPALAIVGALSALLANVVVEKRKAAIPTQWQDVSGNGVGIQAGGDARVGDVGSSAGRKSDAQ